LFFFWVTVCAAQSPSEKTQVNLIGGELLGRPVFYSINYERHVASRVSVGVGLAWLPVEVSSLSQETIKRDAVIVPVYSSWTPLGDRNRLYLAGGATFGWSHERGTGFPGSGDRGGAMGTATIGYERRTRGGFVFRPSANLLYLDRQLFPWPGLLIGHTF
jgi:hypothetical protein